MLIKCSLAIDFCLKYLLASLYELSEKLESNIYFFIIHNVYACFQHLIFIYFVILFFSLFWGPWVVIMRNMSGLHPS